MDAILAVGRYFDGRSAKPHAVSLRLDDRLAVSGDGVSCSWPLADLRADDATPPLMRLNILGDPGQVEVADEAFARALSARCPDLRKASASRGGALPIVLWSLAAGLSVLAAILFGVPAASGLLAPLVPATFESRIGAVVEAQVIDGLGAGAPCAEAKGRAALDRLVARLVADRGLPPDLRVTVLRDGTANALTLPGARILVLSDLIAKAQSADEFAGVLAHELGHAAVRDPTRALIQASSTSFLLSLVLGDLTGSTIVVALSQAVLAAGYSREAERAADAYSVVAMTAAGGDAAALAAILERIAQDGADDGAAFLRSHPFTRERAATIRALAGPQGPSRHILGDSDWTALKAICPAAHAPKNPGTLDGTPGRRI